MTKEKLELLRLHYPVGATVELQKMNDKHSPPIGTRGKILHVDNTGTIHIIWQNGSTLGVLFN